MPVEISAILSRMEPNDTDYKLVGGSDVAIRNAHDLTSVTLADADTLLLDDASATDSGTDSTDGTKTSTGRIQLSQLGTYITGASTFSIDNGKLRTALSSLQSSSGDTDEEIVIGADSGDTIVITGNLKVSGTTTTVNTANLIVEDKNIELGKVSSPTDTTADGGGITLKGDTDKTFNWVNATDAWTSSEHIQLATGKNFLIDTGKIGYSDGSISNAEGFTFTAPNSEQAYIEIIKDAGDGNSDFWAIHNDGNLKLQCKISGSYESMFTITPNATTANSTITIPGKIISNDGESGSFILSGPNTDENVTLEMYGDANIEKWKILDTHTTGVFAFQNYANAAWQTMMSITPNATPASSTITIPGTLAANAITVGGATLTSVIENTVVGAAGIASTVTVSANNSTDETVYPVFVDSSTGFLGLESDTGLTYNPSSGVLTATAFSGNLTGNVTGNTSGSSGSCTGNAATATKIDSITNSNIVQLTDSQTLTNKTITTPVMSGPQLKNGNVSAGYIDFFEDEDNGNNYVRLIGPASTNNATITLPTSTGTVALTSDSFTVAATTNTTPSVITPGDTLTIAAGTGITTTATNDGTITIAATGGGGSSITNYVTNDADDLMVGKFIVANETVPAFTSQFMTRLNDTSVNASTNFVCNIIGEINAVKGDNQSTSTTALNVQIDTANNTHSSTGTYIINTGIEIDLDANTSALSTTQLGMDIDISGGDAANSTGIRIKNDNGGEDIKCLSSADNADYFSISTTTNGATTIKTVDGGGNGAHLTFDVTGQMFFDSNSGFYHFRDNGDTDDAFRIQVEGGTGATTLKTFSQAADGNLKLEIDGDIELNADGGDIVFKDDAAPLATINSDGLTIRYDGSSHAVLNSVNGAGDFTISTVGNILGTGVTNEFTLKNAATASDQYAVFGNGSEAIVLTSKSTQDIKLNTNSGTDSGFLHITNGPNGLITLEPNGTGTLLLGVNGGTIQFATNSFLDANGNAFLGYTAESNAVNELLIGNSATGNAVTLASTGTDTNVPLTITTKGAGAVTVDSGSNIELNADGGSVNIKDDSASMASITQGRIELYPTDAGDKLRINTTTNGVTSISTNDNSGGNNADLTLDAAGDIVLDSANGNFLAKNNGTEFSAANSSYAGMILGYSRIANNATGSFDSSIALTSTMTVLQTNQGTDVKVTFVAPPSGNVEIKFSCRLFTSSTTVGFALSDNATFNEVAETNTYDAGSHKMDETDIDVINVNWAVTGLTAGNSYTYYIAGVETSLTTSSILHGRFRTTGKHYPPLIVKAIALPATIFTGE